jgi:hypothetical protein
MRDSSAHVQLMRTWPAPAGAPAAPPVAWTPSRILAAEGAAGPPLFLALATLAGLLDLAYDARTQTVSDLAVGPHRWLQTTNFFLLGRRSSPSPSPSSAASGAAPTPAR